LAFMLTRPSARSRSAAMLAAIAGICGAIFGACAMIVASMLAIENPAAATFRAARATVPSNHARVGRIGVGKVRSDVAEARGTEQRVSDRVQQHVGVRMAEETLLERNRHPADNKWPPRNQRVNVEALPDAERRSQSAAPNSFSARSRSSACVTLKLRALPATSSGFNPSASTALASSVT